MTCSQAFAYALALKGGERTFEILQLLDESKRQEVKTVLESVKGIAAEEIRQRWCERRLREDLPEPAGA